MVEVAEKGEGRPQAEVGRVAVVERAEKGEGNPQAEVGRAVMKVAMVGSPVAVMEVAMVDAVACLVVAQLEVVWCWGPSAKAAVLCRRAQHFRIFLGILDIYFVYVIITPRVFFVALARPSPCQDPRT